MYQWDELFYVVLSFFGFLYAVLHVGEEKKKDTKKEAPKKEEKKGDPNYPRLKPEAIKKAMPKVTKVQGKGENKK